MTQTATPRKKLDADLLTHAEIERLLAVCSKRAPTGVRNAALIAVLWRCGLRISEALALHLKDVDLDKGTIVVQHGKGDKRRVVGLDAGTAAIVQRWLTCRAKRKISRSAPVICTLNGGSVDSSYVRHLLPRVARKAGIEKRVHAHGLRHAYAIDLIQEGATITTTRDLLGHSSVAVTDRYLTRIGSSEAIDFARSRVWQDARSGENVHAGS
jgi:site-specific recombinase XerD